MTVGRVHSIQSLGTLDGPGVRFAVFLQGCNLRCSCCHNPDTWDGNGGTEYEAADVLKRILRCREYFGKDGGVTVSGGEPLLQPDLSDFVEKVKGMGFSVKLDTNGSDPDALEALLAKGNVDYVAMDIKSSPDRYEIAIGKKLPTERFFRSVEVIRASGVPHEFRTTLVKGIHVPEDMEGIGRWLCGEQNYYLQTFVDSGNLLGKGFEAFTPAETKEFLQIIRKYIPLTGLRGQEEGE